MKHKNFENWILEGNQLSKDEAILLKEHLKTCPRCRQLKIAWTASEKQLLHFTRILPQPGFTQRWQNNLTHQQEKERSKQVRRVLILVAAMMLTAAAVYAFQNQLFNALAASFISRLTSLFFAVSKFLADFNTELNRTPILYYGCIGLIFGMVLAFFISLAVLVWKVQPGDGSENQNEA